ncbi:NUDIX domain-containing protein [Clostridium sp. A1-XYC3]|uniref:NUDIX domain-containing protein n=1 Tax=Clostridium tanneri TaxID=3037988 RepID=A0ABU4JUY9_9CLOT|nr:NUDIX domain-containing protein [Clostridium sp. A1-XYC3]MDW8801964.1 NUDIX domain-containing protein [Clostridium sp. A1-XYC3]
MKIRTRAAAIILDDLNRVLLVKHRDPDTDETWWTLPGGGIEAGESAVEALTREVKEECGIKCIPKDLVYVREYVEWHKETHHISLFFTAAALEYNINIGIDPEFSIDKQFIIDTAFLSEEEIRITSIDVYPEILRDVFWEDFKKGFCGHKVYLGQQK